MFTFSVFFAIKLVICFESMIFRLKISLFQRKLIICSRNMISSFKSFKSITCSKKLIIYSESMTLSIDHKHLCCWKIDSGSQDLAMQAPGRPREATDASSRAQILAWCPKSSPLTKPPGPLKLLHLFGEWISNLTCMRKKLMDSIVILPHRQTAWNNLNYFHS